MKWSCNKFSYILISNQEITHIINKCLFQIKHFCNIFKILFTSNFILEGILNPRFSIGCFGFRPSDLTIYHFVPSILLSHPIRMDVRKRPVFLIHDLFFFLFFFMLKINSQSYCLKSVTTLFKLSKHTQKYTQTHLCLLPANLCAYFYPSLSLLLRRGRWLLGDLGASIGKVRFCPQ